MDASNPSWLSRIYLEENTSEFLSLVSFVLYRRVQLPPSVLPSTEDGLFGTMATKEFALLNPYEACYFYKIDEEKDLAYVRYQPLKGARKHPQMTSTTLATARRHYLKVQELIASKGVK